ncbi:hypothetical protein EVAR_18511_1 [Eumeta japonica]|uniref:Uncharacterized protein n=1 Tax=Eumeta variegata TaxID=151549 RepID=A0A4C1V142_EUMVA|nr:hypothetical protein EVAR_18511_1 [Eumeta japonica]
MCRVCPVQSWCAPYYSINSKDDEHRTHSIELKIWDYFLPCSAPRAAALRKTCHYIKREVEKSLKIRLNGPVNTKAMHRVATALTPVEIPTLVDVCCTRMQDEGLLWRRARAVRAAGP